MTAKKATAKAAAITVGNVTILTHKQINAKATSVAGRAKTLVADIHQAAVSCLYHASKSGDTTLLTTVINATRKGHKTWLSDWARAFGPIESVGKDGSVALKKGWKAEDFRLVEAAATTFEAYGKTPSSRTVDAQDIIDRLNRTVKAKDSATTITTEQARIVAAVAAKAAAQALAALAEQAANSDAEVKADDTATWPKAIAS